MAEFKVVWKIVKRKVEKDINDFEKEVNDHLAAGWKLVNGTLGGTQGLMVFLLKE